MIAGFFGFITAGGQMQVCLPPSVFITEYVWCRTDRYRHTDGSSE